MKENPLIHSFQNHYSKRINHSLQGFPYVEISPIKGAGVGFVGSPCKAKSLNFFLLLGITPPKNWVPLFPDHKPNIRKKVSVIAFRQILSKILPKACIFSNTIITYLKKFIGTKSFNTKHWTAGLSPRIYPIIPVNIYGKPWEWGRIPPNSQKFPHFSHQKNSP